MNKRFIEKVNKKIIEASQLPDDEKIYLRKGGLGWKVVYPITNEDGKINWKHLLVGGSWWNLLFMFLFVALALLIIFEYVHSLSACVEIINRQKITDNILSNYLKSINLS